MKKILFVALVATAFMTSCVKQEDIYRGEERNFSYTPSYLQPVMVGVPINGIATVNVGGKNISLRCITPSNPTGDGFVIDAPIIPKKWEWYNNGDGSGQYGPSGFTYNAGAGFTNEYCKVFFVEIFANGTWRFFNGVGVPWGSAPNPASWTSVFRYPNTWVDRVNLPFMAVVSKPTPTRYLVTVL